jgi:protein TonB
MNTIFLRGTIGKGMGVSAVFHVGVIAVLAYPWPGDATTPVRLAGSRQVIALEASFAEQPAATMSFELPIVEIQPGVARFADQRFVDRPTSTADWELSEVNLELSQLELSPTRRPTTTKADPEVATVEAKPIPRTELQPTPAVSLPEVVGLEDKTPPKFFDNRPPRYPELARQRGWEGTALLRITIDKTGRVTKVEVARSSGYALLDAAAVNAVRTWRGEPARRRGQPLETVELLPVKFSK